jgi:glycosyltransferase involved in cell wall biosynthesis
MDADGQARAGEVLRRRAALAARLARVAAGPGGVARVREILRLRGDAAFDGAFYLSAYADVRRSGMHPAEHYVLYGRAEGRLTRRPVFDAHTLLDLDGAPEDAARESTRAVTPELVRSAHAAAETGPAFSIVMPTWNRAQTIGHAIRSVLAQSYTRWELLVCDDGSTDGTDAVVTDLVGEHLRSGRVRYLRLPHRGVSAARNAGLRVATHDWVAYLDSDNAWHEHMLLITAAGVARSPERRTAYAGLRVHDAEKNRVFERCRGFDWARLAQSNFIDLNVFAHERRLFDQLGGFDEGLTRLVDWDLILRYTRVYPPKFSAVVLADYYLRRSLNNITLTERLDTNWARVWRAHRAEAVRSGSVAFRPAYVLADWPALSQTFVLEEIRELAARGIDVRVYYTMDPDARAERPPDVPAMRVRDAGELAEALERDERTWVHTHFVYPAVTLLAWPACERVGIPFTFMPHAVDIFHHANRGRNRVGEIARSDLCAGVIVYGDHHREFLIGQGVPPGKIIATPQAVAVHALPMLDAADRARGCAAGVDEGRSGPLRVCVIGRLIEKKGVGDLLDAAAMLPRGSVAVTIHGYGPLEGGLRARAAQHGLGEWVRFAGTFDGAEGLRAALGDADVLCLPCCEAENGDVDGMPTVFFEAMAMGVPCIAGAVSAIPDFVRDGVNGFLVPPRDPAALARVLGAVHRMPRERLRALAAEARAGVEESLGSERTADTLLDVAAREPIDVIMVTYHQPGSHREATRRAVRSVLERTTTPFLLTIVDNASDAAWRDELRAMTAGSPRIRLIDLASNVYCGPATNIGMAMARSEFVFYVCSNEGLILKNGWERAAVRFMRARPRVALAGQLSTSPAWPDGAGYARQSWFEPFRAREFVRARPHRPFAHVQGGLWCLRREAYARCGGFSPSTPQARMDVEYSCHLEACGWELGQIPGFFSLSNKTRPTLAAMIDETAAAAHPVLDHDLDLVVAAAGAHDARCNACGWRGHPERAADRVGFDCPSCGSTPLERACVRWLACSGLTHRRLSLWTTGQSGALARWAEGMFERAPSIDAADVVVDRRAGKIVVRSCDLSAALRLGSQRASVVLGIAPGTLSAVLAAPVSGAQLERGAVAAGVST